MSNTNGRFPFSFDWTEMQSKFIKDHFGGQNFAKNSNLDLSWIEGYVNNILGNALNQNGVDSEEAKTSSSTQNGNEKIKHEMFDTHDYLIIKLQIPVNVHPKNIKVFLDQHKLKIEGVPENNKKVILLPITSRYQGSKAIIRDNLLEIRITKDTSENYRQLNVHYLK